MATTGSTSIWRLMACWLAGMTIALAAGSCQLPPPAVQLAIASPSAAPTPSVAATDRPQAVDPGAAIWALQACQSCHGALAQGADAPALRGTPLDLGDFAHIVRSGAQGMRPYSPEEIGDPQVSELHAWLQALPAAAPTPIANHLGFLVPPGVRVARFSDGRHEPAGLALGPDGAVYVTERAGPGADAGQVVRLVDADDDGQAEQAEPVVSGLSAPRGLAWLGSGDRSPVLLVATSEGLMAVADGQSRLAGRLGSAAGRTNDVAVGTDGLVYVVEGAAGDAAPQPGAVWRFDPAALLADGPPAQADLFVTGLRNAAGIAWSPSGAIYITDNGQGWPFRVDVPDELNVLLGGGDYGWPLVWGKPPPGSGSIGPMALFPARSDAGSLLFYSGLMFDEYAGDLLVALPGQGKVVRVEIVSDVEGYHSYVHDFIGGLERPAALAEGPQGELYVADAAAGAVYRFWR